MTDLIGEVFDPTETAVAAFEIEEAGTKPVWLLEAYFATPPNEDAIRDLVRPIVGDAADDATFHQITPQDWVKASLDGLKPVRAGRFVIHGAHDRSDVKPHELGIEIEAALAFGTGHHGTTRGCLLAFVREIKRRRPQQVLDVGTGTGVLAFAAARVLKRPVIAGDIDPVAIEVADANARLNAIRPFLRLYVGPGVRHQIARGAGADLIFANILARPLMRLASTITAAAARAPSSTIILSGLIPRDVNGVLFAYRQAGFSLERRTELEGWATLVLRRSGIKPARRRPDGSGRR